VGVADHASLAHSSRQFANAQSLTQLCLHVSCKLHTLSPQSTLHNFNIHLQLELGSSTWGQLDAASDLESEGTDIMDAFQATTTRPVLHQICHL
jgi:hypothetical protein